MKTRIFSLVTILCLLVIIAVPTVVFADAGKWNINLSSTATTLKAGETATITMSMDTDATASAMLQNGLASFQMFFSYPNTWTVSNTAWTTPSIVDSKRQGQTTTAIFASTGNTNVWPAGRKIGKVLVGVDSDLGAPQHSPLTPNGDIFKFDITVPAGTADGTYTIAVENSLATQKSNIYGYLNDTTTSQLSSFTSGALSPTYATFGSVTIEVGTPLTKLSTPGNVVLADDKVLTWDSVADASSYKIVLYKDGTAKSDTITSNTTSCDLTSYIKASGKYTATVQAIGDGVTYSNGDASSLSNEIDCVVIVTSAVSVGNVSIPAGSSKDVPVMISALPADKTYNGAEIEIAFDKNNLQFVSGANGDVKAGLTWNFTDATQANTDGTVRVTFASDTTPITSADIDASATKTLFNLKFKATVATSDVTPTKAEFYTPADPSSETLAITGSDLTKGTVTVTAGAAVIKQFDYTGEAGTADDYTIYFVNVPASCTLVTAAADTTSVYCYDATGKYVVASKSASVDFTTPSGTPAVDITFGDVNGDNDVDGADAFAIAQSRANFEVITDTKKIIAANVNGDSNITVADAVDIIGKILSKITTFKVIPS